MRQRRIWKTGAAAFARTHFNPRSISCAKPFAASPRVNGNGGASTGSASCLLMPSTGKSAGTVLASGGALPPGSGGRNERQNPPRGIGTGGNRQNRVTKRGRAPLHHT